MTSIRYAHFIPPFIVNQPHVCQVVASINENVGGVAVSVPQLAENLSNQGFCSHLFTLDYQKHGQQAKSKNIRLHSYPANWFTYRVRGWHLKASSALCHLAAEELDLIHNHGLWMFPNLYARWAATQSQIPLVISTRGMLEPWSLQYNRFKKWFAWFLYEQQNLKKATLFHATSTSEAQSIRQLGFKQPIALIPNGVEIPDLSELPSKIVLIQKFPELADRKWLLFLSRIHPKKGLENLLQVWQNLAPQFSDWHLVIAGQDLIGYQAKLENFVARSGLTSRVTFTGMLTGDMKAAALGYADLFVLPTQSENFGIAIAESLAYGLPVITTQEAPWQELESHHCGWWITNQLPALSSALIEAMQLPQSERQAMGSRGRELVERKYSWNFVAQQMADVYHWLLMGGSQPTWVQMDREELR